MAISPQQLTISLYSAHRAVIFAIAQLSCYYMLYPYGNSGRQMVKHLRTSICLICDVFCEIKRIMNILQGRKYNVAVGGMMLPGWSTTSVGVWSSTISTSVAVASLSLFRRPASISPPSPSPSSWVRLSSMTPVSRSVRVVAPAVHRRSARLAYTAVIVWRYVYVRGG